MILFIVESPSKAKTISKYLGSDFTVKSSIGHIRDLPKSNSKAIDIEKGFVPHYVVDAKKKQVVEELTRLGKKANKIILVDFLSYSLNKKTNTFKNTGVFKQLL
jgi:DNA topoisomerase-1